MTCTKCNNEISELDEKCPYCGEKFEDESKTSKTDSIKTYADRLNTVANVNMILSVVAAMIIWFNLGINQYEELNWYGIVGGITILFGGYTLFLLLKTVVDIYNKK